MGKRTAEERNRRDELACISIKHFRDIKNPQDVYRIPALVIFL